MRRPVIYLTWTCSLFLFNLSMSIAQTGQTRFLKTYGTTLSEYAMSICLDADSGFAVTGIAGTRNSKIPLTLVHTTCDGNSDWQRYYMVDTVNVPAKIRRSSDGGYFIFFTSWSNNFNDGYTALLRTDASGQPLWSRSISSTSNDKAIDMRIEGDRILLLSAGNYNVWYPTALLTCLDFNGNLLWSKEFGGNYMFTPSALAVHPDGTMAIAVTHNSAGMGTPSFNNVALLVTDSSGNLLSSISTGSYYDDDAYSLTATPTGWAIAGRTYRINSLWDASLLLYNKNGTPVRQLLYDAGGSSGENFRDVISLPDGGFACTGDKGGFDERDILLSRLDSSGNQLWNNTYPVSPFFTNYAFQVIEAPGSGFALTGDMRPPGWYRDLYLLKTDSAGEIPCYSFYFSSCQLRNPLKTSRYPSLLPFLPPLFLLFP